MKNRTEKFVSTLPDGEMLNLSNIAETVIIKSSRDGHLGRHLVPFHHLQVPKEINVVFMEELDIFSHEHHSRD